MGESSRGLNKKSAVGWDGWTLYASSEVDCLQRKTDEPVKKFF